MELRKDFSDQVGQVDGRQVVVANSNTAPTDPILRNTTHKVAEKNSTACCRFYSSSSSPDSPFLGPNNPSRVILPPDYNHKRNRTPNKWSLDEGSIEIGPAKKLHNSWQLTSRYSGPSCPSIAETYQVITTKGISTMCRVSSGLTDEIQWTDLRQSHLYSCHSCIDQPCNKFGLHY
ncbi:hypothetical protein CLF_110193 [Clonorchis sinensis]|uniref:Uncharacterized protein n=1 Tax=Clonorchis sinensis TaxID=79923 RepID=G7YT91_CLOSI|nr:hypothetical protein CLF_110193 [Clonorchis sinensis]